MISKEKASATINIRVDKDLKAKSEQLFNELGLNLSSAVTLFLKQSMREKSIPFEITLNTYNAETIAAMEEARKISRDPNTKRYKSFAEVLEDLDSDTL